MLTKGLSFIHKHGISHLDISLENVLVTKTDELRICDFGQAERKRTIQDTDLRRGKPKYMSPEVYQLEKYDGFKADVWSLGVVLWGMTTGGLIYKKPSYADQRFLLLTKGQDGLQRLLQLDEIDDTPPPLIHLLSKMLEVNAENRYLIEDVLAHPWLNLNAESSKHQLPKLKTPVEQKKLPPSPTLSPSLPPISPLPPSLSPPRPSRHAIPFITNTPTGKTVSPVGFRYGTPFGDHPSIPTSGCPGDVSGSKKEGFVDVQLCEYQRNTSALGKEQQSTILDRSRTEPEQFTASQKSMVTADNKEVRVRTFSLGCR